MRRVSSIPTTGQVQPRRSARSAQACLHRRAAPAADVARRRVRDVWAAVGARTLAPYWREVVRSGEYARLGVYALEAYGIFKVRFVFFTPVFLPCLFVRGLIVLSIVASWRDGGA